MNSSRFSPTNRLFWVFMAAALVLVAPIWLVSVVPTQDGPVHLAQADMIARFDWNGALSQPFSTFYEWNPRIEPNYSVYALLAGLIWITGDAFTAQSLYWTLFGVVYAGAAFWAARTETDRPLFPFVLLLPLAFGMFTHLGFLNYVLGFPAFLLFACLWRRFGADRNVRIFLLFAAVLFALALTHVSTLAAACLLMGASGLARAIAGIGSIDRKQIARRFAFDAIWSLAAALPALVLVGAFLTAYSSTHAVNAGYDILPDVRRFVTAGYLFSFTWWEVVALAPLIIAMAVGVIAALWRARWTDLTWPLFIILIVLVSLLDLKTARHVTLAERLAAFSWIGAALGLAGHQPEWRLTRILTIAAAFSLVAQSGLRALAYVAWSATLNPIIATGQAHPGQTFAGLNLGSRISRNFEWRVHPAVHLHQLAAIAARGVGMGSTLPSRRYFGYYPLRYVEAHDLLFAAPLWEWEPETTSLKAFRKANGGAPNVLIVTGEKGVDYRALAQFHGYGSCAPTQSTTHAILICIQR